MRRLLSLKGGRDQKEGLSVFFLAEEAAGQTDQHGHARDHRRADDAGYRGACGRVVVGKGIVRQEGGRLLDARGRVGRLAGDTEIVLLATRDNCGIIFYVYMCFKNL